MRKFERVAEWAIEYGAHDVELPRRATKSAAGYDFFCPTKIVIAPGEMKKISTNIKALMNSDEVLILCARSSFAAKFIYLPNAIGVIDSDFYGNESNDGNMSFTIANRGDKPFTFEKGDKLGQGFFIKYLVTDDDIGTQEKRKGGFGSTGKAF